MAFIGVGKISFMFYVHHLVSVLMFYGVSDEGVLHIFAKKNVEVDFHDLIAIVCRWLFMGSWGSFDIPPEHPGFLASYFFLPKITNAPNH